MRRVTGCCGGAGDCGNGVIGEGRMGNRGHRLLGHVAADAIVGGSSCHALVAAEATTLVVVAREAATPVKIKCRFSRELHVRIMAACTMQRASAGGVTLAERHAKVMLQQ